VIEQLPWQACRERTTAALRLLRAPMSGVSPPKKIYGSSELQGMRGQLHGSAERTRRGKITGSRNERRVLDREVVGSLRGG
jgi:hypothetical protein